MRIFFPTMHNALEKLLAIALDKLGHRLVLPDASFDGEIAYSHRGNQDETRVRYGTDKLDTISFTEFMHNPPDVIFVSCREVEDDVIRLYNTIKQAGFYRKLAYYSGNENVNYAHNVQNAWVTSIEGYHNLKRLGVPNVVLGTKIADRSMFTNHEFKGDKVVVHSYVKHYQQLFPKSHMEFCRVDNLYPATFRNYTDVEYKNMPEVFASSVATYHLKDMDGCPNVPVESIISGRPVITTYDFAKTRRLMEWIDEGVTGFLYSNDQELDGIMQHLHAQYAHDKCLSLHTNCYNASHRIFRESRALQSLEVFLSRLV